MLYQPRGANISTTNTPNGDITTYGNAGNYEMRSVSGVTGNNIGLEPSVDVVNCTVGLKNSYAAGAQVIRVPQYSALTVNAGASITSSAWNGSVGGVVAPLVQNSMTVNGSITVNSQGFRGGIVDGTDRAGDGSPPVSFVSDANPAGGQKGEGIASDAAGTFGGVALAYSTLTPVPAYGGGGGGSHNAGGGGGANAAIALTPYCTSGTATYSIAVTTAFVWCGQGAMPGGVTGAAAWAFDPGYKANGGALTAHVGGGRGGYSYSQSNRDALVEGPGLAAWAGDQRRAQGGWGGRPVTQALATRVFFGGGGGAGGNNNNAAGAGGGVVIAEAGSMAGTGAITANGGNGASTTGGGNNAPGGAGAGGSVVLRAASGSISLIQANGGAGGLQIITTDEAEGPVAVVAAASLPSRVRRPRSNPMQVPAARPTARHLQNFRATTPLMAAQA